MALFLVESYVADTPTAFETARERARLTARDRAGVQYVESTYVPGDETVMHLFDAPSHAVLEDAVRRSGLQFDRIVEAINEGSST